MPRPTKRLGREVPMPLTTSARLTRSSRPKLLATMETSAGDTEQEKQKQSRVVMDTDRTESTASLSAGYGHGGSSSKARSTGKCILRSDGASGTRMKKEGKKGKDKEEESDVEWDHKHHNSSEDSEDSEYYYAGRRRKRRRTYQGLAGARMTASRTWPAPSTVGVEELESKLETQPELLVPLAFTGPFRLLALPAELQLQILRLVLISDRDIVVTTRPSTSRLRSTRKTRSEQYRSSNSNDERHACRQAILLCCRALYHQGTATFYGSNTFTFANASVLGPFIRDIGEGSRAAIRSVRLEFSNCPSCWGDNETKSLLKSPCWCKNLVEALRMLSPCRGIRHLTLCRTAYHGAASLEHGSPKDFALYVPNLETLSLKRSDVGFYSMSGRQGSNLMHLMATTFIPDIHSDSLFQDRWRMSPDQLQHAVEILKRLEVGWEVKVVASVKAAKEALEANEANPSFS